MPPKQGEKLKGATPKTGSNSADHSYTRASDPKGKPRQPRKSRLVHKHDSSDYESENEDQAPCHMCKKTITMENDGIKCNFCEHWLCYPCSKLKRVVYQALRESPDNVMWFCDYCCTAFPGVKKVMVQIGSLEDKYTNLEERVDKLEENSQNEKKIKEFCRKELLEQQEIEKRKLNLVVFNVPESEEQSPESKKADDIEKINELLDGPMKLDAEYIQIQNPFRLGALKAGKPNEPQKPRPIKITVDSFDHKNKILKANAELRKETGKFKSLFFTPDLTQMQRKEAFLLREQLRYQKNVLKKQNVKISRGRIVEIEQNTPEGNKDNENVAGGFKDVREGATAMAGHPSTHA